MKQLIEFYEMVSMNDAALCDTEKTAIVDARLALRMFERAMASFKTGSAEPLGDDDSHFLTAA